jgi:thioredoxin 1
MKKLMVLPVLLAALFVARCVQGPAAAPPEIYIPDYAVALGADNFDSLVTVAGLTAMVDFFSPECADCRAMDTVVDNLAKRFGGRALVGRVNVLEEDSLTDAFSIGPIPSFVFFKSGVEYERVNGVVSGDSLAAVLERD